MYKMVFDTETTSLDRPFCYDVGYIIFDTDTRELVKEAHYVVEQVWHNRPLFESAYYKEKRPLYVNLMRSRQAILKKWGHIMQDMIHDIKRYNITDAYAYNSDFDDKVFTFNCDWYKCNNPFDNVQIHDIRGYASECIVNSDEYKAFCEKHSLFTDSGNYSGTAESVYRFISKEEDFSEAHMGAHDAEIETSILIWCIDNGAEWDKDYKVTKIIPRLTKKPFTIKVNGQIIFNGEYVKKYCRNDSYNFTVMG